MAEAEGDYPTPEKVLRFLGIGAFLAFSMVMPGLPLAFAPKKRNDYKKWKKFDPNRLKQTVNRLKERGLVTTSEENGKMVVKVTKEGEQQILKYKVDEMKIKRPARWDGKWRFVIFDIPNKRRKTSNLFRQKLKDLEFFHLQKSIFVHSFPCEKEIKFLRILWEIEPYVRLVTVDHFEGEGLVRLKFGL